MNVVILQGHLSSDPRDQELESGVLLVRYEVTVPRDGEPADSVPVAWFGPPTARPAVAAAGEEVVVVGRVRRRWWKTQAGRSASSTEVVADSVVPATDRRRVAAALRRARPALE